MSSCKAMLAKFSEYLDGRLTGREMHSIADHLDRCAGCAGEWIELRRNQAALASLGPAPAPEDLVLRIRVAVSRERARRSKSVFAGWALAWRNTVGPFVLQAGAGFASAVLLLGTVTVMVGMFTQPESAQATKDVPLGNATAPRLLYSMGGAGKRGWEIGAAAGQLVVEAYINSEAAPPTTTGLSPGRTILQRPGRR